MEVSTLSPSATIRDMSGRIFVSSTCYDLLDLRAEVEAHLKDLGLAPLLSDRPSSEFEVVPDANSIETCLANVRDADAFVCILSQRYGPSLKDSGYDDVSATYLEWREAKDAGKPIYMYVRDRLEGEHAVWKRNPSGVNLAWTKDPEIFDFLEEHRQLVAKEPRSNWYWTFRDSVELKQRLSADLGGFSRQTLLKRMMEEGVLPIVRPFPGNREGGGPGERAVFHLYFAARGTHPALDLLVRLNEDEVRLGDLEPGKDLKTKFTIQAESGERYWKATMLLNYQIDRGYQIEDEFHVLYDTEADGVGLRIQPMKKRLLGGPPFILE